MEKPFEKILDFFKQNNISVEILEHEPVFTSEQAAKIRGVSLHQGAKALLLKADGNFILIVLPGDKRLNTKKVKLLLGVKDLNFAKPEEVKEVMGCEIGACYPFGNLINVKMIVDQNLSENEIISFNPGVHNKSIKIKWSDYFKSVKPTIVDVIE